MGEKGPLPLYKGFLTVYRYSAHSKGLVLHLPLYAWESRNIVGTFGTVPVENACRAASAVMCYAFSKTHNPSLIA